MTTAKKHNDIVNDDEKKLEKGKVKKKIFDVGSRNLCLSIKIILLSFLFIFVFFLCVCVV